jgi:hypothetical protein
MNQKRIQGFKRKSDEEQDEEFVTASEATINDPTRAMFGLDENVITIWSSLQGITIGRGAKR